LIFVKTLAARLLSVLSLHHDILADRGRMVNTTADLMQLVSSLDATWIVLEPERHLAAAAVVD